MSAINHQQHVLIKDQLCFKEILFLGEWWWWWWGGSPLFLFLIGSQYKETIHEKCVKYGG